MTRWQRCLLIGLACTTLAACGAFTPPTTAELSARMVEAMGGRAALENIEAIALRGAGMRTRMGQIPATGAPDPVGRLLNVTETIDLAQGRAALDYEIVNGEFTQHRTEVYTQFRGQAVGWSTAAGRPNEAVSPNGLFSWATQNSPEMLLRRNVIAVALAAAASASDAERAEARQFAGKDTLYGTANLGSGEQIGLYFDRTTGLLAGFVALDTETMLGDVAAIYRFEDYRAVGPLVLPFELVIDKQAEPYAAIQYDDIRLNAAVSLELFAIPADVEDQAEQVVAADGAWAPLRWTPVAPAVFHAVGFSHHSMVVEFPSFVVVVEAPYTEAQGQRLGRVIEQEIGKPVRFVVPSHPHYDHTGGVRAMAALGATVLVAAGHEAQLRGIVEAPHTNPPDELARRAAAGEPVGAVEVFAGSTAIEEGAQRLELYEVETIPHVNPTTLAYVASSGALFQSDLFFGGPSPDAAALYAAIVARDLDVETIVGGHGGIAPLRALVEAASAN